MLQFKHINMLLSILSFAIPNYQILFNIIIMMQYLFMKISNKWLYATFILVCFLAFGHTISVSPDPFCQSKPLYHSFPLTLGEILSHDMSSSFSGYNLNITLKSNNSFATLGRKMIEIDRRNTYIPNIISHKVEHNGNTWGKEAFILFKTFNTISLSYGHFTDNPYKLPVINFTVPITNDPNINCFDAAMFFDYGIAIVDCVEKSKQPFIPLVNYFYYVDLTNHNVVRRVQNDMYVSFTSISKRKIYQFKQPITGQNYFLRAYIGSGVDERNSKNTYMELYSATDPNDLQLLRIIDRSFLHQSILSISDFKVYLGDIFMLDPFSGLYRLDILRSQEIAITGRYIKPGFTKFSVYSDDLEQQVIVALSNNHSVYEIDWHIVNDPVLINKYSLMQNSNVKQLILNDEFLIVQASAFATNATVPSFEVDYTWVFTKGSRTFSHAYAVIDHNSSQVEVELDKANNRLMFVDESGYSLIQLDEARLVLHQTKESTIGSFEDVVIYAESWDYHSNQTMTCQEKFTVYFVNPNNVSLWKTGLEPATNVTHNYPGQTAIPLSPFALGPLIQYKIINPKTKQIPEYWVDKLNQTALIIDKPPIVSEITFFYTQVIPEDGNDQIIYYYEDSNNITHVALCNTPWQSTNVQCVVQAQHSHNSAIKNFVAAYFQADQFGFKYYYMYVLKGDPKRVQIIDFNAKQRLTEIVFPGDLQGVVGCLGSSNGYLYVLLSNIKTINVYKLSKCQRDASCPLQFVINADTLKSKGVDYFAPQQIITNYLHPEVLFIKCLGSVLILDIDNKERITKLDEIITQGTKDKFFKVAVNNDRMTIVSQPNIIEEYDLRHLYIKNFVTLLKNIPTYGYKIQPNADIQFSDFNHLLFVNAIDPSVNKSVVLIYKTGMPATSSLYQVITLPGLYSRPGFQIQVSGFYVDFLSIIADGKFYLYRVFQDPWLRIKNSFFDFTFQIEYYNPLNLFRSQEITLSIVNYPSEFQISRQFNETMSHTRLKSIGTYSWSDRKWWLGQVVNYNYSCQQCSNANNKQQKVRIREHVDAYTKLQIGANDYIETFTGGISVWNDLFRFRYNGSVREVINLPDQKLLEYCTKVTSTYDDLFVVTACQYLGRGVNLYATSLASFKPHTWGPYRSSAWQARQIAMANEILMLVDTSMYPQFRSYEGAIFLYQMTFDKATGQEFDELQVIDSNDFYAAHGWDQDKAYLGNAHLVYAPNTKSYRLYVTEIDNGLFIVDFTHPFRSSEINVVTTYFVDLNKLLIENKLRMPGDSHYEAVTFVSYKYNPQFDIQNILVTTKGYHHFQISLVWDDTGHLVSYLLHRVYYRYAYYNTYNLVKATNGYVAIGYVLPSFYQELTKNTRQWVAIYDTQDYPHESQKGYSQRYILGAYPINHTTPSMFSFNTTYDFHTNGTRIGIVIAEQSIYVMNHASVSKNLTIQLRQDFKDQTITITPYSDFNSKQFTIQLINPHDDDETIGEQIFIIVIIVICIGLTIFFIGYIIYITKKKNTSHETNEPRVSLLTEEESIIAGRDSVANQIDNRTGGGEQSPTVMVRVYNQENQEGQNQNEESNQHQDQKDQNQDQNQQHQDQKQQHQDQKEQKEKVSEKLKKQGNEENIEEKSQKREQIKVLQKKEEGEPIPEKKLQAKEGQEDPMKENVQVEPKPNDQPLVQEKKDEQPQ